MRSAYISISARASRNWFAVLGVRSLSGPPFDTRGGSSCPGGVASSFRANRSTAVISALYIHGAIVVESAQDAELLREVPFETSTRNR